MRRHREEITSSIILIYLATAVTGSPTGWLVNETTTSRTVGSTSTANSRIIDSPDDIMPIQSDTDSVRSSVVFFSASLSMFAAIGIIIFFRKCVTCPSRRHGRRRHYYPADGQTAGFRTGDVCSAPVTAVVNTDGLDEIGLDATVPLTPSLGTDQSGDQYQYQPEEEINSASCSPPCRRLSRGLADSTSGFRFYDDDEDDIDDDDEQD